MESGDSDVTNRERDAFHSRRAYGYVKAAIKELVQINSIDSVRAKILRELYRMEDDMWQLEPKEGK